MQLSITKEFTRFLVGLSKKDTQVATALARQFLLSLPVEKIMNYLFSNEVAVWLLSEKLKNDPTRTFGDIEQLLQGKPVAPSKTRRGRKPKAATAKKVGRPRGAVSIKKGTKKRRRRMNAAQHNAIKEKIQVFLSKHPWSSRKTILGAIDIPSAPIYHRLMTELREQGAVMAQGQKAKTLYAMKGSSMRDGKKGAKRGRKPKKG